MPPTSVRQNASQRGMRHYWIADDRLCGIRDGLTRVDRVYGEAHRWRRNGRSHRDL